MLCIDCLCQFESAESLYYSYAYPRTHSGTLVSLTLRVVVQLFRIGTNFLSRPFFWQFDVGRM